MTAGGRHIAQKQVREYVGAVLDKDRRHALSVIEQALESKKDMLDAFNLLAAAQSEIGEMWAKGIVSVADEHFATNVTLECIDIVARRTSRPNSGIRGLTFLCTVEGEYHLVGLEMFSELLRSQGWETVVLGSNCSAESLLRRAKNLQGAGVELLCISATMPSCVPLLLETLKELRSEPIYARAKIVVGGHAVASRKWLGAFARGQTHALVDFVARDYESALKFTATLRG